MRVLLVEDEIRITDAVSHVLQLNGIEVDVANDGDTGLLLAERTIYDVLVLDIMLPGLSGLDILRSIRQQGVLTPVLLLTARDTTQDIVNGLDLGADDYMVKPFVIAELMARIRALSRRTPGYYRQTDKPRVGNVELDTTSLTLTVGKEKIKLSLKEAQILEFLMRGAGFVYSKEQILDRVWGYDAEVQENIVEIYIHHLRKKLEPRANVTISTVRGIGYSLKEL